MIWGTVCQGVEGVSTGARAAHTVSTDRKQRAACCCPAGFLLSLRSGISVLRHGDTHARASLHSLVRPVWRHLYSHARGLCLDGSKYRQVNDQDQLFWVDWVLLVGTEWPSHCFMFFINTRASLLWFLGIFRTQTSSCST